MDSLRESKIPFNISFTITPDNYKEIYETFKFCKDKGVSGFSCRFASSGAYFDNVGKDYSLNSSQMSEAFRQLNQIGYADHYLIYGVKKFGEGMRVLPCGAGYFSAYVTPDLEVLPCTHCPLDWSMGNLRDFDYSFEKLLDSEKARKIRREKVDKCKRCINDVEFCATYGEEQIHAGLWLLVHSPKTILHSIMHTRGR
jgi:radical SAM protein with 4Fe4S-binding SPASM domain